MTRCKALHPYKNVLIEWTILLPNPIPSRFMEFLCQVAHTKWYLNDEEFFNRMPSPIGWESFLTRCTASLPYKKILKEWTILLPNLIPSVSMEFLRQFALLHTHTKWYLTESDPQYVDGDVKANSKVHTHQKGMINNYFMNLILVGWQRFYDLVQSFTPIQNGTLMMKNSLIEWDPQ